MLLLLLLLATTCLVDTHAAGNVYVEDRDRFPGWKGELPAPSKTRAQEHNATQRPGMAVSFGQPDKVWKWGNGAGCTFCPCASIDVEHPWCEHPSVRINRIVLQPRPTQELWNGHIEQISWQPRIFRLHGFLTDAECEHIKRKARPRMTKSTVVDSVTGESVDSDVRTSTGTFFARQEDKILSAIEKRIAMVTMLPEENGEGIQVLKYVNGQEYKPHNDYFHVRVGVLGGDTQHMVGWVDT